MSKKPCVQTLVARLAEMGIEGVTEVKVSTMVDAAMSEAKLRGLTDPKAIEDFTADRVFDKIFADSQAARDSAVAAEGIALRALAHVVRAHPGDPKRGLKSLLVGTLADRDSVGLNQSTATNDAMGELNIKLEEAGVLEAFIHADDALTKEIYNRKVTNVSKDAMVIRGILEELETRRLVRIQMAGLEIEPLANRMARQYHDPHLIANARKVSGKSYALSDRDAYIDFVMGNIDRKATFSGEEDPKAVIGKMFDDFVIGRNNVIEDVVKPGPDLEIQIENPLTAERKLYFTPEGEVNYMMTFGAGSLRETVYKEINLYGKQLGLLQKLGPTPYNSLRRIVQDLRTEFPEDKALMRYTRGFDSGQLGFGIGWDFAEVSGMNAMVLGTRNHDISSWLQTWQFMSKMGQSGIAAIGDVPGMAAEFNYQQGNPISALAQAVGAVINGINTPKDQRAVIEAMGIGVEGMLNDHSSRIGGSISPSVMRTKLLQMTFKMNMLAPWTDSVRRGLATANSRYMATVMQDIDNIRPRMKALINSYGISDADLSLIAKEIDLVTIQDAPDMFSPANISRISSSKFGTGEEGLKRRMDIQRKFTSFFIDRNDFGVYTPDASVRSLVHAGLPKGEPIRVILDLFTQFKQYGIGMVYRPLANSYMGPGQSRTQGAVTLATHMAFLLPFGALVTHIKDGFKGKEQYIPQNKEEAFTYFGRAMFQSGAYGIAGEVMQAGILDNPYKALARMTGPTVNDLLEYGEMGAEAYKKATGQKHQLGNRIFTGFRNDIPMADTFWLKTPLDYGMMYGIGEALDPGFLAKYEKQLKARTGGRGLMIPQSYALGVK